MTRGGAQSSMRESVASQIFRAIFTFNHRGERMARDATIQTVFLLRSSGNAGQPFRAGQLRSHIVCLVEG